MFFLKKGGNFQTGEPGWVPLFPVSERAGTLNQHFGRTYVCCVENYLDNVSPLSTSRMGYIKGLSHNHIVDESEYPSTFSKPTYHVSPS